MSKFIQHQPDIFDTSQWHQIGELLKSLDTQQTLWLSGYLAGQAGNDADGREALPADLPRVLVAYASETGNSEKIARQLAETIGNIGIPYEVANLSAVKLRHMKNHEIGFFICSTHGDGDPPESATLFFDSLTEESAMNLGKLSYSVLALGDSSYEKFCSTGHLLDQRLTELGGKRIHPLTECDVDFSEPARAWTANMSGFLAEKYKSPLESRQDKATENRQKKGKPAKAGGKTYNKNTPLEVEVVDNVCLSHASRKAPVHHIELALDESDIDIKPGDAIGILVSNPPALAAFILKATGLSGDEPVIIDGKALPLAQALRQERNLTIASKRFLETWAELSKSDTLRRLVLNADTDQDAQKQFLSEWQLRDIIANFPAYPEAQMLVDILRPLQPRLYDVANSLSHTRDEIHITVSRYQYVFRDREETGIASEYLLNVNPGDHLSIYPYRNARFHLPENSAAPVILIGSSAGVAPYRAFVQEIMATSRNTPCWLVFSEQSFEDDFLYQTDWQQAQEKGCQLRVDPVFGKSPSDAGLAPRLLQNKELLQEWLGRQAHVYFCGDKDSLSRTEMELARGLAETGTLAAELWEQAVREKRLHRNLY